MLSSVASIESFLDDNYISVKTYEDETLQEFVERHPNNTYLITMKRTYNRFKRWDNI